MDDTIVCLASIITYPGYLNTAAVQSSAEEELETLMDGNEQVNRR
jgi:hypothetical protein